MVCSIITRSDPLYFQKSIWSMTIPITACFQFKSGWVPIFWKSDVIEFHFWQFSDPIWVLFWWFLGSSNLICWWSIPTIFKAMHDMWQTIQAMAQRQLTLVLFWDKSLVAYNSVDNTHMSISVRLIMYVVDVPLVIGSIYNTRTNTVTSDTASMSPSTSTTANMSTHHAHDKWYQVWPNIIESIINNQVRLFNFGENIPRQMNDFIVHVWVCASPYCRMEIKGFQQ
jgi:hypothetical protein